MRVQHLHLLAAQKSRELVHQTHLAMRVQPHRKGRHILRKFRHELRQQFRRANQQRTETRTVQPLEQAEHVLLGAAAHALVIKHADHEGRAHRAASCMMENISRTVFGLISGTALDKYTALA